MLQNHVLTAAKLDGLRAKLAMDAEKFRRFAMEKAAYEEAAARMDKALVDVRKFLEEMGAELQVSSVQHTKCGSGSAFASSDSVRRRGSRVFSTSAGSRLT